MLETKTGVRGCSGCEKPLSTRGRVDFNHSMRHNDVDSMHNNYFGCWNLDSSKDELKTNLCNFLFFSLDLPVERHRTVPHLKYGVRLRRHNDHVLKKCDGKIDHMHDFNSQQIYCAYNFSSAQQRRVTNLVIG